MDLIDVITSPANMNRAVYAVRANKGAAGIDKMETSELTSYMAEHSDELRQSIVDMKYKPQPVRRVYIPKPNGKKRPLGIPVVVDRVVQQATAQALVDIFDPTFSDSSFGFRPNRSAHDAVEQALGYLNEGYQWVIDLDIEKFFDRVNHDKLISIIREKVNDKTTLHLIRNFLRAGVMEEGKVSVNEVGTPQGGPLSPVLSNIYLDVFDKELDKRGLRYCRFADDVVIFVRTEKAAERVMKSVSSWLKRKLFLDVSPTKTKIVRPSKTQILGFTYWASKNGWKAKPTVDRKRRLYDKIKTVTRRKRAVACPLSVTFTRINQIVRGWINYFSIGSMHVFLKEFGPWMRHKVRVIILKQWKRPKTIFANLTKLNNMFNCRFTPEQIRQTANSRLGLYRSAGMKTMNYILSPYVLSLKNGDRPGLINPLDLYDYLNSCK